MPGNWSWRGESPPFWSQKCSERPRRSKSIFLQRVRAGGGTDQGRTLQERPEKGPVCKDPGKPGAGGGHRREEASGESEDRGQRAGGKSARGSPREVSSGRGQDQSPARGFLMSGWCPRKTHGCRRALGRGDPRGQGWKLGAQLAAGPQV